MNAPSQLAIRPPADKLEGVARSDHGPDVPGRGVVQAVGQDAAVARCTAAGALSALQQFEHLLRQRVGLGHHGITGLLKDL